MSLRALPLALACLCIAGCASSLHQVPADQPHGVVQFRFAHESHDFLYETQVMLDDEPAVEVREGKRVRLRPGQHSLALISIAHEYGLGNQAVSVPGQCVDTQCRFMMPRTEQRTGLVEVGRKECQQRLDVTVIENVEIVVLLEVAADHSCSAQVGPGEGGHRRD